MQLLLILAVVAALAISEFGPQEPVSDGAERLLLALGGVVLVATVALAGSTRIARRLQDGSAAHSKLLLRFRRLRRVHVALWMLVAVGTLYWLDWTQLVRFNWRLDRAFLLDEMLILAPVVLPLVLSWAAFYDVDRAARAVCSEDFDVAGPFVTRRRYLTFHVRHYLGLLLVPVFVILAVQDAGALIAPEWIADGREALLLMPALALLMLLFPLLLRCLWETRPLEAGPLRTRLEASAGRWGFRLRELLVWQTGGMVVNAAVAGFVGRLRYVFLTDGLLLRLSDDEIEAVFGHELGHVRHRHLLLRLVAMVAPLSLWTLVEQARPVGGSLQVWLAEAGLDGHIQTGLLLFAGMAVYLIVAFGYFSRQLEHQADLFACRFTTPENEPLSVESFGSALEKLAIVAGIGRNAFSWQHASIARRIDFLKRMSRTPQRELRFHRRVRLLGSLVVGAVISPVAWPLLFG